MSCCGLKANRNLMSLTRTRGLAVRRQRVFTQPRSLAEMTVHP